MGFTRERLRRMHEGGPWVPRIWYVAAALVMARVVPSPVDAQQSESTAPLVFDGVTVVDVEQGKLIPDQRVVIVGNRIQSLGDAKAIALPPRGQTVDARGKYLIPGLWDMHVHPMRWAPELFYPLFIAYGITGIRDAGSDVPLDTLAQWRREILAGTRVGPPRQILSGPYLDDSWCVGHAICASDLAEVRHIVDSLKAAGADMIKIHEVSLAEYFAAAAEARRLGIPFGGHLSAAALRDSISYLSASDSGASIIDHFPQKGAEIFGMPPIFDCWGAPRTVDIEHCQSIVARLRRNGTWWVPTLVTYGSDYIGLRGLAVYLRFKTQIHRFWGDSAPLDTAAPSQRAADTMADSLGYGYLVQRLGIPMLAGTDAAGFGDSDWKLHEVPPGLSLHGELALFAAEGITPSMVLRTATLEPAKLLHATDSLGTIAVGKLADLVLLDADPLADIANTTKIRAVVANGQYYDRTILDRLSADAIAVAKERILPDP